MSNTAEFLKFPPLGLINNCVSELRFLWSRVKNWKRLEAITVEDWLTKLSGKRTLKRSGAFAYSKAWACYRKPRCIHWATTAMYAARNSGLKKEMFRLRPRRLRARYWSVSSEVLVEKSVEISP